MHGKGDFCSETFSVGEAETAREEEYEGIRIVFSDSVDSVQDEKLQTNLT